MKPDEKLINAMMQKRKINIKELMDITGISRTAISNWVNGKNKMSFNTMCDIAKACGYKIVAVQECKVYPNADGGVWCEKHRNELTHEECHECRKENYK